MNELHIQFNQKKYEEGDDYERYYYYHKKEIILERWQRDRGIWF